jgi:MFS transporter, DHA1 family, inner membrane transport protein
MSIAPAQRALLAMALGAFALATGEFVTVGLLPNLADDFKVTIPQAGHLLSAYALGVVVGGPLLTVLTIGWSRRRLLIFLAAMLAAGNVASGLIPTFHGLLLIRFLAGLPHAAYFGVCAVAAGNLVEAGRRNAAVAVVLTGFTVANVVGVPLATLIGQHAGWRAAFMFIGLLEVIAAIGMFFLIPRQGKHGSGPRPRTADELLAFRNVQVWLTLGIAAIGGGAMFATVSYITPMMTRLAGYSERSMPALLVLMGIGLTAGNLVGARMANRGVMRTICLSLAAQMLVALAFFVTVQDRLAAVVTLVLFPFTFGLMLPPLQARIIALAGGGPNLASTSIHSAFNVANSLGAWLGGLTIAAGFGYASPNLVSAGLAGLGLILALVALRIAPKRLPHRLDFFTEEEKEQLQALAASASSGRTAPVWPAGPVDRPAVSLDLDWSRVHEDSR